MSNSKDEVASNDDKYDLLAMLKEIESEVRPAAGRMVNQAEISDLFKNKKKKKSESND